MTPAAGLGVPAGAQFADVRVQSDRLIEGAVTFENPALMALTAAVDTAAGTATAWAFNPPGPAGAGQLVVTPRDLAILRPDGLSLDGAADVTLGTPGGTVLALDGRFANGFRATLNPVGIAAGRLNLSQNGRLVAYVDGQGYHRAGPIAPPPPPPDAPVVTTPVAFSGRIGLPDSAFAYVQFMPGSIQTTVLAGGRVRITAPGTVPVGIVGATGLPEVYQATVQNVEVDAATRTLVSGTLNARIAGADLGAFRPQRLVAGRDGVQLTGRLVVFGREVGAEGSAVMTIAPDGTRTLTASTDLAGLAVPLSGTSNRLALRLGRVEAAADGALTLKARLELREGEGVAAVSDVDLSVSATGAVEVQDLRTVVLATPAPLVFGGLRLRVEEMQRLTLAYDPLQRSFTFEAPLTLTVQTGVGSGATTWTPTGAVLRESGLFIPAQELSFGEANRERPGPVTIGGVELQLLAVRLPRTTFDVFTWREGDRVGIEPRFDFTATLPGLKEKAPELAATSLTFQDVGTQDGLLVGAMVPYRFLTGGKRIAFSNDVGVVVNEVTGAFTVADGKQGIQVGFTGAMALPDRFARSAEGTDCPAPAVALSLSGRDGLSGSVRGVSLCRPVRAGAIEASFSGAALTFAVAGGKQQAALSGRVTARLMGQGLTGAETSGDLSIDLVSGAITAGALAFSEVKWSYPVARPMVTLDITSAQLTGNAIAMSGNAVFAEGTRANVGVKLDAFTVSLSDGRIQSGTAQFDGRLGALYDLSAGTWSLTPDVALATTEQNKALLTLDTGVKLSKDGLALSGGGGAAVRMGGMSYDGLTLAFKDELQIGFDPFGVRQGKLELARQGSRIAYFDRDGFHADNVLAAVPIPARLALPSLGTAYLELRAGGREDGAPLVQLGALNAAGTARTIQTAPGQSVRLVLAGLKKNGKSPEVRVALDLEVDKTTFLPTGAGSVSFSTENSPVSLAEFGLPLDITRLEMSNVAGVRRLAADARLVLPRALREKLTAPIMTRLVFSDTGLETLSIVGGGAYAAVHNETGETGPPLATLTFSDDFRVLLRGVEARLDNGAFRFAFSGDILSRMVRQLTVGTTTVTAGKKEVAMHFASRFDATVGPFGTWTTTLDPSTMPGGALPIGEARFTPGASTPLTLTMSEAGLAIDAGGVLSMPKLDGFAVAVTTFHLGTDGARIEASAAAGQRFTLFKRFLQVEVAQLALSVNNGDIRATLGGTFETRVTQAKRKPGDPVPAPGSVALSARAKSPRSTTG